MSFIHRIVGRTALLAACAAAAASPMYAATVSPYFGWNQSASSLAGPNAVDAFATGASSNNNIATDGVQNVFTILFDDGDGAVGTATFEVTDTIGSSPLRQLDQGLSGPVSSDESIEITLIDISNIVSDQLLLVSVSRNSDDSPNSYTSVLPDGSISDSFTPNAIWQVGQSLSISHLDNDSDSFNLNGFTVSAAAIPSPGGAAMLMLGLAGLGTRRRSA